MSSHNITVSVVLVALVFFVGFQAIYIKGLKEAEEVRTEQEKVRIEQEKEKAILLHEIEVFNLQGYEGEAKMDGDRALLTLEDGHWIRVEFDKLRGINIYLHMIGQ